MKAMAVRLVLAFAVFAMVGGLFGQNDTRAAGIANPAFQLTITAVCSDGAPVPGDAANTVIATWVVTVKNVGHAIVRGTAYLPGAKGEIIDLGKLPRLGPGQSAQVSYPERYQMGIPFRFRILVGDAQHQVSAEEAQAQPIEQRPICG
jgi:hypothetical protein